MFPALKKRFFHLFLLPVFLLLPVVSNAQVVNFSYNISSCFSYGPGCDSLLSLIKSISNPDMEDSFGNTYIHSLSGYPGNCCKEAIALLIEKGASPNVLNHEGKSALDIAVKRYNDDAIILLMEHGWMLNNCPEDVKICAAIREKDYKEIHRICNSYHFFYNYDTVFLGARLAYTGQQSAFLEGSFFASLENIGWVPMSHIGFSLGSEFGIDKPFVLGPKFAIDYRWLIFVGRGSFIYYTSFEQSQPVFSGDIGLSLFGFAEFTVGKLLYVKGNPLGLNDTHFSVVLNIPLHTSSSMRGYYHFDEMHSIKNYQ